MRRRERPTTRSPRKRAASRGSPLGWGVRPGYQSGTNRASLAAPPRGVRTRWSPILRAHVAIRFLDDRHGEYACRTRSKPFLCRPPVRPAVLPCLLLLGFEATLLGDDRRLVCVTADRIDSVKRASKSPAAGQSQTWWRPLRSGVARRRPRQYRDFISDCPNVALAPCALVSPESPRRATTPTRSRPPTELRDAHAHRSEVHVPCWESVTCG